MRWLLRRAWAMEIHGYQSIYRFVFRRPRVPTGAVGFTYSAPILSILIVLTVVSAVELVVVDLIVHRWAPGIRVPLLILGAWGLVWLIGLLLGVLTRPHAVGPDGVRVRFAADVDIPVSWEDIYSVGRRRRTRKDGEPALIVDDDGSATLHVRVGDETNLEIVLERDLTVRDDPRSGGGPSDRPVRRRSLGPTWRRFAVTSAEPAVHPRQLKAPVS